MELFNPAGRGRESRAAAGRPADHGRTDVRRDRAEPRLRAARGARRHVALATAALAGQGVYRAHARHAAAAATDLHLLRAAGDRHPARCVHRRRDRPDAELLRLHLRSVSRRHPGDAERPARRRRGARHDASAGDAPHRAAAGDPHRHPDARQLLHLAVQGYRAVLGR